MRMYTFERVLRTVRWIVAGTPSQRWRVRQELARVLDGYGFTKCPGAYTADHEYADTQGIDVIYLLIAQGVLIRDRPWHALGLHPTYRSFG